MKIKYEMNRKKCTQEMKIELMKTFDKKVIILQEKKKVLWKLISMKIFERRYSTEHKRFPNTDTDVVMLFML